MGSAEGPPLAWAQTFLLPTDPDLVTAHPTAVNIRPPPTGLPTGEATAFTPPVMDFADDLLLAAPH